MRLGLLGPAEGNVDGLTRAAEFLVNVAKVDRAIYLGEDGALDTAVTAWARRLVESDPSDDAAWSRAAQVALRGSPDEIDAFVRRERARQRLRVLEALPPNAGARTIEMIGDRVAVLLHDKAMLDEEDIFGANLLVFGKSPEPLVKKVGTRWFMTPGVIGSAGGGAAVLDDSGEEIVASIYGADGRCSFSEPIAIARATKMKIQGGA
ncbi:MAG TPA: hypothetical protein VGI39_18140 [Polyangiaceae bacterium]|jgi:hypothetical protein